MWQLWIKYDVDQDYCYYTPESYNEYDWNSANEHCHSMKADLVSIHSPSINYLLSHRDKGWGNDIDTTFWIGLNTLSKRGLYKWSDNSEVEYLHFANVTSDGDSIPQDVLDQGKIQYSIVRMEWLKN